MGFFANNNVSINVDYVGLKSIVLLKMCLPLYTSIASFILQEASQCDQEMPQSQTHPWQHEE